MRENKKSEGGGAFKAPPGSYRVNSDVYVNVQDIYLIYVSEVQLQKHRNVLQSLAPPPVFPLPPPVFPLPPLPSPSLPLPSPSLPPPFPLPSPSLPPPFPLPSPSHSDSNSTSPLSLLLSPLLIYVHYNLELSLPAVAAVRRTITAPY